MLQSITAIAATLATLIGLAPPPVGLVVDDAPEAPEPTASSWALYDVTAGVELASRNGDVERPMASVTKIMTALVVRDHASLDDVVVISESAAATGEAEIGVLPGERWTVYDLLAATLIRSGNDAAVALAEHVGGSVDGFASLMNAKAAELGLEHTAFTNPHGLDAEGHYTSARDLVVMAEALLDDPVLSRLVRTKIARFRIGPDGRRLRADNTNHLLGVFPGVIGMKTGFTNDAGRVLVSVAERSGRTLVAVVMGSEDHFADSRELLEYGFATYGLRDRLLALTLEEQGGGGVVPGDAVSMTALEQRRLRAMPELDSGRWATSSLSATVIGRRIQDWMRSVLPVTLGGRP